MNRIFIITLVFFLIGCSATHFVEPLKKGDKQAYLAAGGPMVDGILEEEIPLPLVGVGVGKGLTDKLTYFNTFYVNPLQYGITMFDVGILYGFREFQEENPVVPGISLGVTLNVAYEGNKAGLHIWPQMDFNAYWKWFDDRFTTYIGVENWFELYEPPRSNNPGLAIWYMNPHLGQQVGSKTTKFQLEMKYLTPYLRREEDAYPFNASTMPNGKGFGLFLGLVKSF